MNFSARQSKKEKSNSICVVPPRIELWAIGMGFDQGFKINLFFW